MKITHGDFFLQPCDQNNGVLLGGRYVAEGLKLKNSSLDPQ